MSTTAVRRPQPATHTVMQRTLEHAQQPHSGSRMNSMSDFVERLHNEFGAPAARSAILAVVRHCRDQLDAIPQQARPEQVERLVRQRLLTGNGRQTW